MKSYKSTDLSSPIFENTAGSTINLLEKCLITGYGSKLGSGWTKVYHSSDVAVFKTGAGSNGFYLEIDDSISGYALIRGYRDWNVSQGSNPFPRLQSIPNLYLVKNVETQWCLYSNSKIFYLIVNYADNWEESSGYCFGDIDSLKNPDGYETVIIGKLINNTDVSSDNFGTFSITTEKIDGNFLASSYFQNLNPQPFGKINKNFYLDLINATDNTVYFSKVQITEGLSVRGSFPELWRCNGDDDFINQGFLFTKELHYLNPDLSKVECFLCNYSRFFVEVE